MLIPGCSRYNTIPFLASQETGSCASASSELQVWTMQFTSIRAHLQVLTPAGSNASVGPQSPCATLCARQHKTQLQRTTSTQPSKATTRPRAGPVGNNYGHSQKSARTDRYATRCCRNNLPLWCCQGGCSENLGTPQALTQGAGYITQKSKGIKHNGYAPAIGTASRMLWHICAMQAAKTVLPPKNAHAPHVPIEAQLPTYHQGVSNNCCTRGKPVTAKPSVNAPNDHGTQT